MPKATGVEQIERVGALGDGKVEIVSHHWKLGSRVKVDPVQGYQALRSLYEKYGAIKPEHVVAEAAAEDSVLHDEFEWDDAAAAKQHREDQARHLLRAAVVVYRRPDQTLTQPVRAFVKLVPSADDPTLDAASEDAVQPHVYLPIRQVMEEADLRERHKRQAFRELSTWRQRYAGISEFAVIFEQIDKLAESDEFKRTG
jgi:hypothetical protein